MYADAGPNARRCVQGACLVPNFESALLFDEIVGRKRHKRTRIFRHHLQIVCLTEWLRKGKRKEPYKRQASVSSWIEQFIHVTFLRSQCVCHCFVRARAAADARVSVCMSTRETLKGGGTLPWKSSGEPTSAVTNLTLSYIYRVHRGPDIL